MNAFNNLKVRYKLLIVLMLFSLVPMVVFFGITQNSKEEYYKSYASHIERDATLLNEVIDRNLFERYGDVQAFGLNTASWDSKNWRNPSKDNPLIQAINGYIVNYGFYKLSMLLDTNGNVLAVNSVDAKGKDLDTSALNHMNFADSQWFKDALAEKYVKGPSGLTGTAIQEPAREKIVADVYKDDGYSLVLSAQVKNGNGQLLGVWANFMDFGTVADIVADKAKKLAESGQLHTEVNLINSKGVLLYQYDEDAQKLAGQDAGVHYNFDQIGKRNLIDEQYPGAADVVSGKNGSDNVVDPDTKIEQIVGFNKSDGEIGFPGLGWSVMVAVPKNIVFRTVNEVENQMLIAFTICLAVFGGLATYIGLAAAAPIQKITKVMGVLAKGDKTVAIPMTQQKDELGEMARTLEVFKNNLIESERMMVEQAKMEKSAADAQQRSIQEKADADKRAAEAKIAADQKAEADRKEAMRKLADDFEASVGGIVQGVASAATELRSNAEGLTQIASSTNAQAATVASATEEASASVQTVATAAEELTSSISEISRQINESTRITQQAVEKSRATNQTMTGLSVAAEKIGDVVKLIQDIAGQTNLLALNATIEAARAGDAGKGFAVVASEVKNLANQTEKATGDISEQIAGIQQVSQSAVTAIQEIGSIIERINDITAAVAAAVEEQSAATQEIARNTEQASAGTREVSNSIQRVSEGAQESGSASNELLSASSELSVQAEKLREQMGSFLATVRAA